MKYAMFTSYFGFVEKLPESFEPIAICGGIPSDWNGLWTRIVAPKKSFFNEWKYNNHDNDYYIRHFNDEVLSKLNPNDVVEKFFNMANGKFPCLICYEKPNEFCHRHLVAEWINSNVETVLCCEYSKNTVMFEEECEDFDIFQKED